MDVSLTYDLTAEDYIDSQLTYNRYSDSVRKSIKRSRISMLSFYSFAFLVTFPTLHGLARIIVLGAIAMLGISHIVLMDKLNELRNRKVVKS